MSSPREWIEAVEHRMGKVLTSNQKEYFTWWVEFNLKTPVGCNITKREVKHWARHFEEYNAFIKER